MYIHSLPLTRPTSFADQLITTKLALELTQSTEKRATLQSVLQSNRDERQSKEKSIDVEDAKVPALLTQKDWLRIIQAADEYLPFARGIEQCLITDDVIPKVELSFFWQDTLSTMPVKHALPGIHFEISYILLSQAKASYNLASTIVASLGDYETTQAATLSNEDRKAKEEKVKFAADLLCRAAGTFELVGNETVREWENVVGFRRLCQLERTLEMTREMCFALARLAQGEAELLAIRKLLSPTRCYQTATRTAAPPLCDGHPSPGLLARLYLNAASLFESALSLAETAASVATNAVLDDNMEESANASEVAKKQISNVSLKSKLSSKLSSSKKGVVEVHTAGKGKLHRGFSKYLVKSTLISRSNAYLWLAIERGEKGEFGVALTFLQMALDTSAGLSKSNKISDKLNDDERKRDDRRYFAQERQTLLLRIAAWQKSYMQLNNTVGFQPVPPASTLSSQIPAGRNATTIRAFKLPDPAFGPGSVGFISEGMQRLQGLGTEENDVGDKLQSIASALKPSSKGEEYAGQGAYY